jgi:hypothetical protein
MKSVKSESKEKGHKNRDVERERFSRLKTEKRGRRINQGRE